MPDIEVHGAATALVGRTWERSEALCEAPVAGLWALLDRPPRDWAGSALPPLAHWLYFLPRCRQSQLGTDGHPAFDDISAPPQLPRRMWGGGVIDFLAPLRVGERVLRRSVVTQAEHKVGRSGELLVVTVEHQLSTAAGLAVRERQDIVYRAAATAPTAASAPTAAATAAEAGVSGPAARAAAEPPAAGDAHRRVVRADARLLFRFSALTFNAHRIHYDRDYCREVEGYPGLVVHGPLIALLMLDHAAGVAATAGGPRGPVRRFEFRNQGPLFESQPFVLEAAFAPDAASIAVAAIDPEGRRAAAGRVEFAAAPA